MLNVYILSNEYEMLKGPQFTSGLDMNTGSDYYPIFYDKAAIHSEPKLFTYKLDYYTLYPKYYGL